MPDTLGGRLVVTSPDEPERVVLIDQPILRIGRLPAPQNDLALEHGWVSRQHARLYCDRLPYRIQDLRSSNGTSVNDAPLPPDEVRPLKDGDVIAIGPFRLRLEAPAEAATEAVEPAQPEVVLQGARLRPAPRAAPPPSPPQTPASAQDVRPARWVGMPDHASRWLQYLPPIYGDDEFLGRFLCLFEDLLGPLQQITAHMDLLLDPATAPESFLPWLSDWLAVAQDEHWPPAVQRELLSSATWLYQTRGTKSGLVHYLQIVCPGSQVEIIENADGPHSFRVALRTNGCAVDRRMVERIIDMNRPAHTQYTMEIV